MITALLLQCSGLLLLLLASAFFSSAEVAYFALDPLEVRRMGETHPARAKRLTWILASPTRLLSTILIGNTVVNVGLSAGVYAVAAQVFPHHSEVIAMAIALFMLIIFGEIGPKRVAVTYPLKVATLYAPTLQALIHGLAPLRLFLEHSTRALAPLFKPAGHLLSEEEFVTLVDVSGEEGVLDELECSMVKGIIRLENMKASDVMTPRVDIIGLDIEDPEADLDRAVQASRVRNILLYNGQLDATVGFLDVRTYGLDPGGTTSRPWPEPLYVPETCPLDHLLEQFLQQHQRVAVVVDEYGGTAGVVSRSDVLEEIVGDVDDESGQELLFEQAGPDRWLLDGQVNLDSVAERLDITFEEEGVDRIAGWIAARLERLPRRGDRIVYQGFEVTVRRMRRNRVLVVEIRRSKP